MENIRLTEKDLEVIQDAIFYYENEQDVVDVTITDSFEDILDYLYELAEAIETEEEVIIDSDEWEMIKNKNFPVEEAFTVLAEVTPNEVLLYLYDENGIKVHEGIASLEVLSNDRLLNQAIQSIFAEMDQEVEQREEKAIIKDSMEVLRSKIDEALDDRNEEEFHKLVSQLKRLQKEQVS